MKVLVLCLLAAAALGDAAPSDVPALTTHADTSASSSLSSSLLSTPVKKTSVDSAVLHGEKIEPAVGVTPAVHSSDLDKVKAEVKGDAPVEPVVEAAEPSGSSGQDLSALSPVKKVPVFVPVEYAGAYHPDNFFNPYPVTSGLGGFVAASSAAYPYRSVVHPWYQLVSPEVPIITLYPSDSDESYRGSTVACADPTLRYIHGAVPMIYTGPSAAHPSAANHFAAASLMHGGNPNPYGNYVPYYRFSYNPGTSSYVNPSVDYSRSTLISPKDSPISPYSPISSVYIYSALPTTSSIFVRSPLKYP